MLSIFARICSEQNVDRSIFLCFQKGERERESIVSVYVHSSKQDKNMMKHVWILCFSLTLTLLFFFVGKPFLIGSQGSEWHYLRIKRKHAFFTERRVSFGTQANTLHVQIRSANFSVFQLTQTGKVPFWMAIESFLPLMAKSRVYVRIRSIYVTFCWVGIWFWPCLGKTDIEFWFNCGRLPEIQTLSLFMIIITLRQIRIALKCQIFHHRCSGGVVRIRWKRFIASLFFKTTLCHFDCWINKIGDTNAYGVFLISTTHPSTRTPIPPTKDAAVYF